MKKQNLLFSFLAMFLGLSLVFSSKFVLGQDSNDDKEVKVKIVQNINGEKKIIERNFSSEDEEAVKNLLKEFDVNINENELLDGKQIEISIRKTEADDEDKDVVIRMEREMEDAMAHVSPRAYLGVVLDEVEHEDSESAGKQGVVVAKVMDGSAAEKAGIKEGDLITQVNDTKITGSRQFQELIRTFQPGDEVKIIYQREGKESSLKAALGEKIMPDFPMFRDEDFDWQGQMPPMMKFHHMEDLKEIPFLGVVPGALSEDAAKQEGVVIGDVIEKSTAQELGLQKGDVIVKINGKAVSTFDELRETVRSAKVSDELNVEWKRDGKTMKASAPVKSKAECNAICIEKGMMPPCGDMMREFRYKMDDEKAMSKEAIEKAIEHLEKEMENLKQQLQRLEMTGETPDVKTEETRITITVEDVTKEGASKNTLQAENLLFSPNPSNGKFNLSFELPEKGKTEVKIYDASNKEIYSESLAKFSGRYEKQIDISDNPKGIYFLRITQGDKMLHKKIVIQ